jgi:predicted membrane protein
MNKVMNTMKIVFWGIMLLIGFMLTGSFIAVSMNVDRMVTIMKEKKNTTDGQSPELKDDAFSVGLNTVRLRKFRFKGRHPAHSLALNETMLRFRPRVPPQSIHGSSM